jgi:hypothetical protein
MTYSTPVMEARFKIGEEIDGTIITSWFRTVERDGGGTPTGIVDFAAVCEEDTGQGRCDLCWKTGANVDGQLILYYHCVDVNCIGAEGKAKAKSKGKGKNKETENSCVLQYSRDGETYYDVTPEEPAADMDCYFRCNCCVGDKPSAKK